MMKQLYRFRYLFLFIVSTILLFVLTLNNSVFSQLSTSVSQNEVSPIGGVSQNTNHQLISNSRPIANLTKTDQQEVYIQAQALLTQGTNFRLCRLQIQTDIAGVDCTPFENEAGTSLILENYYVSFNSGELLDAFCPNFNIDAQGNCGEGLEPYRNQLIEARRQFASLYLSQNPSETIMVGSESIEIGKLGLDGMLLATRELAYAHMIFGSEFAINAFDYAFTIEGQAGSAACEQALERYQQSLGRPYEEGRYNYFADAECVIKNELDLLEKSLNHYNFALEVMISGYHDDLSWPKEVIIGELFTQEEIQMFAVGIENYAAIVDEIAIRERQLGAGGSIAAQNQADEKATQLYAEAFDYLNLITLPLFARASELYGTSDKSTQILLESNGLAIRSGLNLLTGRVSEIESGYNVFGFTEEHVPVQSYAHMRDSTITLFDWAKNTETAALSATREFDVNQTKLKAEMAQVRATYKRELSELCGDIEKSSDANLEISNDYEVCVGGTGSLMEQSWLKLTSASISMVLADRRIDNVLQEIDDLQARTEQTILVKVAGQEAISAVTLAQGMARAYQTTQSVSNSVSDTVFSEKTVSIQKVTKPGLLTSIPKNLNGVEVGLPVETSVPGEEVGKAVDWAPVVGGVIGAVAGGIAGGGNPAAIKQGFDAGSGLGNTVVGFFNTFFGSVDSSLIETETKGQRHSETRVSAVNSVFNPAEITLTKLQNTKEMLALSQEIDILNLQTDYEIRSRLRLIAELQLAKESAANLYNQAASEHNQLVNRWQFLKASYKRAREDLEANYLANPAYRLLKNHNVEVAHYQLDFAAKQAYLTAKALEYYLVDDIPFIDEVFKVRHTHHLRDYLQRLESLDNVSPALNETNVEFSLRVITSSIRDQDIANAPIGERQELIAQRERLFRAYLEEHLVLDDQGKPEKLVLVFDTSLENRPINTESRYGWRIAGAVTGATDPSIDRCPVRKPYGVSIEILQGGQTLPNGMTVDLTQAGQASVRQENKEIIRYSPVLSTLLPSEDLPQSIRRDLSEAVADATLDVNNAENTVSDFCNMSVAANSWILEIPLEENQIDYELFQDIKLKMWTFYFS